MEEGSATYGTPNNGASPGANPILAQPPLPDVTNAAGQNEGSSMTKVSISLPVLDCQFANFSLLVHVQMCK